MKINWQNINYFKIAIWLLIGLVVLIVVRFYFVNKMLADYQKYHDQVVANIDKPTLTTPKITPVDPKLGQDQAKHTVVIFGSYTCEQCATVNHQLLELVKSRPGDLRVIWKDYYNPDQILAETAAIAGRCAQLAGNFWDYHNALLNNQASLSQSLFLSLAQSQNLPEKQFSSCLLNKETKPLLEANINEAESLKLEGVPVVYFDDQQLNDLTTNNLKSLLK